MTSHNSMLIDESPLILLPSLAMTLGVNHGLFLQQIHYWLNPKHNRNVINGRHWVYNSYKQWQDQFPFWSEHTIRRIVEKLETLGVLESFVTRDLKTVKYYTINYDRLTELKSAVGSEASETADLNDSSDDASSISH